MDFTDKIITFARKNFSPYFRDFLFPIQQKYFRAAFESSAPVIVLKASRQTMKSFISALIAAIFIVKGRKVVVVAPTYRQSDDVIISHISSFLEAYRNKKNETKSSFYLIDNVYKKVLRKGGKMTAVTASPHALTDGLTCDLLIIDEAQDIQVDVVKERVQPFVIKARQEALATGKNYLGKILVLGRGGPLNSYIEKESGRPDALVLKFTADDIIAEWPTYKEVVREMKIGTPEHIFRANFFCEALPGESNILFPKIIVENKNQKNNPYFGIDWGRKDMTVGVALFLMGDEYYIEDVHIAIGGGYREMAASLRGWIDEFNWTPENIVAETNGVGDAALEILCTELGEEIIDKGRFITAGEKHKTCVKLLSKSEKGNFIVSSEKIKNYLSKITFKYDEKSRFIKPEHNDVLSALIMAVPSGGGKWSTLYF